MLNDFSKQRLTELLSKVHLPSEPFASWLNDNPSGSLPYHGTEHLLDVAENGLLLANLLGLSDLAVRNIVVAGLLHDYDHTGNAHTADSVNITRALSFLKTVANDLEDLNFQIKGLQELIKATLHPSDKKPGSLNGMVIKDADVFFWINPDVSASAMLEKMRKLSEETGSAITVESTREFVKGYRFYSTPAWNLQQKSIWKQSLAEVESFFENGQLS